MQLAKLIPILEGEYLARNLDRFPPIFEELHRLAKKRHIKLEPVKPPRPETIPCVLPWIAHIAGRCFGQLRTQPLNHPPIASPYANDLRTPHEEDAFVEGLAGWLEMTENCVDWSDEFHPTDKGVVCSLGDGSRTEINVRL